MAEVASWGKMRAIVLVGDFRFGDRIFPGDLALGRGLLVGDCVGVGSNLEPKLETGKLVS